MIYYIYSENENEFIDKAKEYLKKEEVCYCSFDRLESLDIQEVDHLLVTGSVKEIKLILALAQQNNLSVGIIPSVKQKELVRTFSLPSKLEDAVELALTPSKKPLDILYANGTVVLQEVVVGDAPPLDVFDTALGETTYIDRIKIFWRTIQKVKTLKHTQMKIIDANDNEIKLSAVGIVGLEYQNNTFASKLVSSQLSASDGKLSMVILSPTSIMQYMGYLFKALVSHLTPRTLPHSVGYIRSSKLYVETKEFLKVRIDSQEMGVTPLMLEVKEKSLALSVGEKFWQRQAEQTTGKDSIKIDHLPSDEESSVYLSKSIPFFSHASKAQYASLFTNLREEGKVSKNFMVLLILATMIATFGLFINSSSVIIGAMLLAPLMQPIVSLSMGVLRQDSTLELNGVKTIAIGVSTVLVTAALMALFTPIERLTSEMVGRLSPTILDLYVAMVSGAAAAYAKSNEKILGSLAGVAIAVALVPPIAVAGIGMGWGNWHMFYSAFLLFVTNLVGIVFSAAFVFAVLGYSPLHLAKKGMFVWLMIVMLVSIPLYSSFRQMEEDIYLQRTLLNVNFDIGGNHVKLTHIELFHRAKKDEIHCEVLTTGVLRLKEKKILKNLILKKIDKEAVIIATFRYLL
ncbi:hypothetical protein MNB_SV-3-515 [hydrothermal vent metagenome]|uniref:TIGR00341 family protein n=1 Tax=hydrothermal vent metagenome TaxID=652676 RepID=A0A1W1CU14_9ZZZZ